MDMHSEFRAEGSLIPENWARKNLKEWVDKKTYLLRRSPSLQTEDRSSPRRKENPHFIVYLFWGFLYGATIRPSTQPMQTNKSYQSGFSESTKISLLLYRNRLEG